MMKYYPSSSIEKVYLPPQQPVEGPNRIPFSLSFAHCCFSNQGKPDCLLRGETCHPLPPPLSLPQQERFPPAVTMIFLSFPLYGRIFFSLVAHGCFFGFRVKNASLAQVFLSPRLHHSGFGHNEHPFFPTRRHLDASCFVPGFYWNLCSTSPPPFPELNWASFREEIPTSPCSGQVKSFPPIGSPHFPA